MLAPANYCFLYHFFLTGPYKKLHSAPLSLSLTLWPVITDANIKTGLYSYYTVKCSIRITSTRLGLRCSCFVVHSMPVGCFILLEKYETNKGKRPCSTRWEWRELERMRASSPQNDISLTHLLPRLSVETTNMPSFEKLKSAGWSFYSSKNRIKCPSNIFKKQLVRHIL